MKSLSKMLKNLLENKIFCKVIQDYLKKENVLDLILFGSSIRGKEKPSDIDLLIIYAKKSKENEEITYKLRKELESIDKRIEITDKSYEELFSSSFLARTALLSEGFSLKNNKSFTESLGYTQYTLFKYSIKNLTQTKRMQFHYSLYGRGKNKGLLDKTQSIKFSNEMILAPINNSELIKDFLEQWKIEFKNFPMIIPSRIIETLK